MFDEFSIFGIQCVRTIYPLPMVRRNHNTGNLFILLIGVQILNYCFASCVKEKEKKVKEFIKMFKSVTP